MDTKRKILLLLLIVCFLIGISYYIHTSCSKTIFQGIITIDKKILITQLLNHFKTLTTKTKIYDK